MELTWAEPAPPIFQCVNNALRGRWVDLACHETGCKPVLSSFDSLVNVLTFSLSTRRPARL